MVDREALRHVTDALKGTARVNDRLVNSREPDGTERPGKTLPVQEGVTPPVRPGKEPEVVAGKSGKLPLKYMLKLIEMMREHLGVLQAEGFTVSQAAQYFTDILGFVVTEGHVNTARKEAEIVWKNKHPQTTRKRRRFKSIKELAVIVKQLYNELGIKVPPNLDALCADKSDMNA